MSEIRRSLQNLTPSTRYVVRTRAINEFGVVSPWSEALDFITGDDASVPKAPVGLLIEFDTPTLILSWDQVTLNTDGTPFHDFRGYVVSLAAGSITAAYETSFPYFAYSFQQNSVDYGSPQPHIGVSIRAIDVVGNRSESLVGTALNPVPPTPTAPATLVASFTHIIVLIPSQPTVLDLSGFEIYHSTTPSGTYSLLTTTTNGASSYNHEVAQGSSHYYKYKIRDVFGQTSPDLSPSATTTSYITLLQDTTPPETPSNLHTTANSLDAEQHAYIDLAWNFNTEPDLASYDLRWRRGTSGVFGVVSVGKDTTSYHFANLATNTLYQFQIRAVDTSSNVSGWGPTSPYEVTTAHDTVAPPAPTNLKLTPGIRTIILQWDAVTVDDFARYHIHVGTAPGFTADATNLYANTGAGTVTSIHKYWTGTAWADLVPGTTYYVKMVAVDATGNVGVASVEGHATTGFNTNPDFQAESITADFLASSEILADLTTTGSIRTASSGARMEMNSNGLIGYANDGTTHNLEYLNDNGVDPPGIIIRNTGYLRSNDYVTGTSGWYFGASGGGTGLLEVNDGLIRAKALQIGISSQNLIQNASFENYRDDVMPTPGPDPGLASEWNDYPNRSRNPGIHTHVQFEMADDVGVGGTNYLYSKRSQKMTILSAILAAGVVQTITLAEPIVADAAHPKDVTISAWAKMESTSYGNRLARVAMKNNTSGTTYTIPTAYTLSDVGWHRFFHTIHLVENADVLELQIFIQAPTGNLGAGEAFFFEGGQLERSSFLSDFHLADLDLPDNYISSLAVGRLSADNFDSGTITSAVIDMDPTGFIQSIDYDGTHGYRLKSTGIDFYGGAVNIVGAAGGVVHLDGTDLRVIYGGTTQLKIDSTGIFVGGDSASNADIYFDTAHDATRFHSSSGSATFEINSSPSIPGASANKVLRLYTGAGTNPYADAFYLTYDGLGYFSKGVIGFSETGAGSNRIHNSSFETVTSTTTPFGGSVGTHGLDYWKDYSTSAYTGATPARSTGGLYGGFCCNLTWTVAGTHGLQTSLARVGAIGALSLWPANSTWTYSIWAWQTGTIGPPTVSMSAGGFTIQTIDAPTPLATTWQRYIYRVIVGGSNVNADLRYYYTHAPGNVLLDGAQLERGEIASAYAPMPEEVDWKAVPPLSSASDILQSSNFVAGVSGWRIDGAGNVEFGNGIFRGTINATAGNFTGSVTVGGGSGNTISSATAGWTIRGDGTASFSKLTITGTSTFAGALSGATGTFTGTLSAGTVSGGVVSGASITGGSITGTTINIGPGGGTFKVNSSGDTSISDGHGLYFGASAYSGSYFGWDNSQNRMAFFGGGSYNPPWPLVFYGDVGFTNTIFARGSIAAGFDYGGGIFAADGSGGFDTNWGLQFYSGGGQFHTMTQGYLDSDVRHVGFKNTKTGNHEVYIDNLSNAGGRSLTRTAWVVYSDARSKPYQAPIIDRVMHKVKGMRPIRYRFHGDKRDRLGFTAQEMQVHFPEVVHEKVNYFTDENGDLDPTTTGMGIAYTDLIPILFKALQEIDERLDAIEAGGGRGNIRSDGDSDERKSA